MQMKDAPTMHARGAICQGVNSFVKPGIFQDDQLTQTTQGGHDPTSVIIGQRHDGSRYVEEGKRCETKPLTRKFKGSCRGE
jgi:hypothetical protein